MEAAKRSKKRLSVRLHKHKRSINVQGQWKAVELDPSLFAEEGMEGLICFEELTNYHTLNSKQAEKQLKKNMKGKKRKEQPAVVKEDVEPPKKKAKKKNKSKAKKLNGQESAHPDGTKETQEGLDGDEEAGEKQAAHEEVIKCGKSTSPDPEAFTKPPIKSKKRTNLKEQSVNDTAAVKSSKQESHSELHLTKKAKLTRDKRPKPVKKQQQQKKNWTEAVLDCCHDRETDVSAWKDLFVPTPVLKALRSLGFGSPTPIQALTLPSAIRDHMDILGAAETGKRNDFPLLSLS